MVVRWARRWGWVVLLCAVAVAAFFGVGAMVRGDVYESTVEVGINPPSPQVAYDPEAADWGRNVQVAHEIDFIQSTAVQEAMEASVGYPFELDVAPVAETTLRFAAQANSADAAANAVVSSATAYAEQREAKAVREADALIAELEARVATLAADPEQADALAAAEEDLAFARQGRAALDLGTAYIVGSPTDPCCPVSPRPVRDAVVGGVLGLLGGICLAMVLERAGPSVGGRLATTGARVLRVPVGMGLDEPAADRSPTTPPPPDRTLGGDLRRVATSAVGGGRATLAMLAAAVLVRASVLVVMGTNLVLDDLTLASNAERFGIPNVVPRGQDLASARPGAWLTFTALYGVIGAHPLVLFGVITLVNVAIAWATYLVVARFLVPRQAACVALLWVLLPTHTTLTVWPGTAQVVVGMVLFLLGVLAFTDGRWLLAGLAMAASILCYELVSVVALILPMVVGTRLLPLRATARPPRHRLTWLRRGAALVPVVGATVWSRAHSVYETAFSIPGMGEMWSAHFGLGLFGSSTTPATAVAVAGGLFAAGTAVCLVAWVRGERRAAQGPPLVLAGLAIIAVGSPAVFTLGAGSLGFADRLYGVTTIGSALVVVGVATWCWRRSETLAGLAVAAFVALCLVGQVVQLRAWSDAGADIVALLDYIEAQPDPDSTVWVIDAAPVHDGVVGASSPTGGANHAYRLVYPEPDGGRLRIGYGEPPDGAVVLTWDEVLGSDDDD